MPETDPNRPRIGEVIAIGDELTTGQRLDTNTQWLAQRLTERGIDVRYHTTVADDLAANVSVFRAAAERADVVLATGGLGPTADDLTRDAMAAAADVPLVEDPELVAHIENLFKSRGRTMPPQNRRQAQLPEGAAAIPNPGGTAPGVDQTIGRCRLFALPGVPAEMKEMWAQTVAPAIDALPGERRVVRHWLVRCFGAGESHIESLLPEMIARGREPLVGITASKGTITLRVTASGADEEAALNAMQPTLAEIRETLGDFVFAEQPGEAEEVGIQHVIIELLAQTFGRVGVFEIMTRGLVGQMLGDADQTGTVVDACTFDPQYPWTKIDEVAHSLTKEETARYGVAIGAAGEAGKVPIAVSYPVLGSSHRVVCSDIKLVGHPSIHRPLVAKAALNLLRLELLKD